MPNSVSLDPEKRTLYSANLQPPAGYIFDTAVATTFSLDFETALAVPVCLALFAAENRDDILAHPLALLEGIERITDRLLVFTDAGHIHTHTRPHSRLCSLLERIIIEVAAPKEGGVFHPKMWAIRFKPSQPGEPARVRLLVLSRNLTRDRSWDIALTLDGIVAKRAQALNRPLADFLRRLPELATAGVPDGAGTLVDELAEDIRRTEWTLPDGFDEIAFAINGLGGKQWQPEPCTRLGVVSPFCDDQALSNLAELASAEKPVLISRSDELALLSSSTLERFSRVAVLDEISITEDGEEAEATLLQGLHAKAFVAERGWDTVITVGSGNATRPALLTGRNVELFASLTGKRSRVGSVDEIFGEKGFGRLTRHFVSRELPAPDGASAEAEKCLEEARRELCRIGLRLYCEPGKPLNDGQPLWRIRLIPPEPLRLAGITLLQVWPITRGDGHARDALEPLRKGQLVDLGLIPTVDITRYLACQLTVQRDFSILFSTGLALDGEPSGRHTAVLCSFINNKDAFFRYLRLLLAEMGDPFSAALMAQPESGHGGWRAGSDDAPILEEMVRAFCRGGRELQSIERLMTRLEAAESADEDPIPAEFRFLWNAFLTALKEREAAHAK